MIRFRLGGYYKVASALESSLYGSGGQDSHVVIVRSAVRQVEVSTSNEQRLVGLITGSGL